MRRFSILFGVTTSVLSIVSCDKKDKVEKPVFIQQEVFDTIFNISYQAIVPCPDCPGIETTLRFYNDSTIVRTTYYEGKNKLPQTITGTCKRKFSILTASYNIEKLFYKIKNDSTILRVGSDLKEITAEMGVRYTFRRTE